MTQGTDIRVPMGLKGMRKGLPEDGQSFGEAQSLISVLLNYS